MQVLFPVLGQISWILSIIGTVLLCYVVIKHVELRLWFYAGLIYTIGMTIAQIDRLDGKEVTQVYTNILDLGAIILTLIAVGWDYYNTFIKNTETALDYRKIHFAFFQIVPLIIIYVQTIMIMLMIICIILLLRIYIKKKTTSRALLFLMLVSIFMSLIADFLKNLGINSSTELFWAMSLIFTTLYIVLSIVVIIEDHIIKLREIEQKNKKEMILTMHKLNDEIKERRRAEIEQIQSEERYKEAYNRAEIYKDLFAHDINNLLQSILLSTQMIEEDLKNEKILLKIEKSLHIIKEQVFRGSNLAENVQKLSQIKEMILFREQIEIIEILKESTRIIKESFQNKEIEISIKSEKEKIFINANSLVNNIFHNLLINAVKYNRSSIIKIEINIQYYYNKSSSYCRLEFIDNGIGIEDNRKEPIFHRIKKQEEDLSGMGLGLLLVKKIIDLYNGKIWVENRIKDDFSQGSKFIIVLPVD